MISVAGVRVDATAVKAAAMFLYVVGFALTVFYGIDALRLSVVCCAAVAAIVLHFWPTRDRFDPISATVAGVLVLAICLDLGTTWLIGASRHPSAGMSVASLTAWFLSVAGILAFPRRLIDRDEAES